jgi:hypothetical protein
MSPSAYPDPDRLRAANINPATGLATDYLNHYNEVAMLIAAIADMPEMSGVILDWRPVDYPTHFQRSRFGEKGLAIAAWELAGREVKRQFRLACEDVEFSISAVQRRLLSAPDQAAEIAAEAGAIFEGIARVGAVINGGKAAWLLQQSAAQDLVDSLFD